MCFGKLIIRVLTVIFDIEFSLRRFCPVLFDAESVRTEQRCCPSDERRRRNRVSRGFLCFQTLRLCCRFPRRDSTAPLRPRKTSVEPSPAPIRSTDWPCKQLFSSRTWINRWSKWANANLSHDRSLLDSFGMFVLVPSSGSVYLSDFKCL